MTEQTEDQYVLLKLSSTNTVLVAKFLSETDDVIEVEYPLNVTTVFHEDGDAEVVCAKYVPYAANNKVRISKNAIFGIAEPTQTLILCYLAYIQDFADDLEECLSVEVDPSVMSGRKASKAEPLDDSVPEGTVFH